jgi:cytidylate kinase
VIFPGAELKVYLTASSEVRARRRLHDLSARGHRADYATLLASIRARDAQDSGRDLAPLRAAPDAEILDTSNLDFDAVVSRIEVLARERIDRAQPS